MQITRSVFANASIDVSAASGTLMQPTDTSSFERLHVDIQLNTLTGGTTPGVTITVQRQDSNGTWRTLYAFAPLTAVGSASQSIGPGLQTTIMIPPKCQVIWATTGAPTVANLSASIYGDADG